MVGSKTREKLAGQVKEAAEKIGGAVLAALAVAIAAIVIATAALFVSAKALRKAAS